MVRAGKVGTRYTRPSPLASQGTLPRRGYALVTPKKTGALRPPFWFILFGMPAVLSRLAPLYLKYFRKPDPGVSTTRLFSLRDFL